ncbi:MAG: HNH endonuclease, partial [Actinomycetia bacterium]|nr:HNH endonuclease [Actinomycetes bacterium]
VRSEVARDLVLASRRIAHHRPISHRLADGRISFDRAIATLRYAETGATPDQVEESFEHDLETVSRFKAKQRRVTTGDESSLFTGRYFVVQPSLDESTYRMWGQVPGVMGRTVEKAITQRADELRLIAESSGVSSTGGQRQADALVTIAQDSLDAEVDGRPASSNGQVTVFIDGTERDAAENGAEIMYGPRVGPNTLEAMLCGGAAVNVVGLQDGVPVVTSRSSRAIPPAIRQRVAHRDGGCTIDGCASRYRLQPHHIVRVADGGTHDVDNLTTLCWYHHHVAIHGSGYRIDPDSSPHRRRLIRGPCGSRGPPPRSPDPG